LRPGGRGSYREAVAPALPAGTDPPSQVPSAPPRKPVAVLRGLLPRDAILDDVVQLVALSVVPVFCQDAMDVPQPHDVAVVYVAALARPVGARKAPAVSPHGPVDDFLVFHCDGSKKWSAWTVKSLCNRTSARCLAHSSNTGPPACGPRRRTP